MDSLEWRSLGSILRDFSLFFIKHFHIEPQIKNFSTQFLFVIDNTKVIYQFLTGEKMKILHALCGKLLTLVSTRDFIEDYVDILRQAKQEFRELKAEQHRKEREEAAAR